MTEVARRVLRFALLGVGSGAAAATAFELADPESFFYVFLFYLAPGLVFGVALGPTLWRCRVWRAAGAGFYAIAAALAHGCAMFTAIVLDDRLQRVLNGHIPVLIVSGVIAGALGASLLGGVTRLLAPVPRWPVLAAPGALLGALLPVAVEGDTPGFFVFYVLWQAGYAATLALILPRIETV
jgi:hypothetical protein